MLVAQMYTSWMLFAGCALLTVILLRRVYRRMGRRQKSSTAPIERDSRPDADRTAGMTGLETMPLSPMICA
mgnify:CR=1 FL=1